MKALIIALTAIVLSLPTLASANRCTPSATSCEFYSCRESHRPCGPQGYWEKFAVPYCKVFLKKQASFNRPTRVFLQKVRLCLQASIDHYTHSASCTDIKRLAFNSHVNCYVDSGFCHLSKIDQLSIASEVRASFLEADTWREAAAVNRACEQLNELGRFR